MFTTTDWILIAVMAFGFVKGFFSAQGALNRTFHSLLGLVVAVALEMLVVWLTMAIYSHLGMLEKAPNSWIWQHLYALIQWIGQFI